MTKLPRPSRSGVKMLLVVERGRLTRRFRRFWVEAPETALRCIPQFTVLELQHIATVLDCRTWKHIHHQAPTTLQTSWPVWIFKGDSNSNSHLLLITMPSHMLKGIFSVDFDDSFWTSDSWFFLSWHAVNWDLAKHHPPQQPWPSQRVHCSTVLFWDFVNPFTVMTCMNWIRPHLTHQHLLINYLNSKSIIFKLFFPFCKSNLKTEAIIVFHFNICCYTFTRFGLDYYQKKIWIGFRTFIMGQPNPT